MSKIRGRDTKPEKLIRTGLHRRGFRFRLHHKSLPGRPDLVLRRFNTVIFVHGCFWHGHGCPLFKMPATRRPFWLEKITGNFKRDERVQAALLEAGWRVFVVRECALKGAGRLPFEEVMERCEGFLVGGERSGQIEGKFV